jgi:hypothetical protein
MMMMMMIILARFSTQSHCHHGCQFHISVFTISIHLRIISMDVKFYLSSLPVVITDIYSISYMVIFYLYILHFIMYSKLSIALFSTPRVLFAFWFLPSLISFKTKFSFNEIFISPRCVTSCSSNIYKYLNNCRLSCYTFLNF